MLCSCHTHGSDIKDQEQRVTLHCQHDCVLVNHRVRRCHCSILPGLQVWHQARSLHDYNRHYAHCSNEHLLLCHLPKVDNERLVILSLGPVQQMHFKNHLCRWPRLQLQSLSLALL